MMKTALLATAAAFLAATPAFAQEVDDGSSANPVTANLTFSNGIETSITNNNAAAWSTAVGGRIDVGGSAVVDSAGNAVTDDKQINDGNYVVLTPSNDADGEETPNALVENVSGPVNVAGASGNVAVNSATGQYNMQANVGTIAAATTGSEDGLGGMAGANTTGAQSTTGTVYGIATSGVIDRNRSWVGDIRGSGNISVNAAAGAFNSQQNLMTLASVGDASLANATAGVIQYSAGNIAAAQQTTNATNVGTISGAGNIAVNAASGVGNLQHNSLTVAAGNIGG